VSFVHANLETEPLAPLGKFDVVFCSGLLYHLPEPWKIVREARTVSPGIFIWTHCAAEQQTAEGERAAREP